MKNYHTHTKYCRHAVGEVEDYVKSAVSKGVVELGFSDHVPYPDGRWQSSRMYMSEFADYCQDIEVLKSIYPQINLLKGAECEWISHYGGFYQDELLGRYGLDYLILAGHQLDGTSPWNLSGESRTEKEELYAYTNYLVKGMETQLFDFIAHPDIFGAFHNPHDEDGRICAKEIFEASVALNVPLEVNTSRLKEVAQKGEYIYQNEPFWAHASDHKVEIIFNSDAHHPDHVIRDIKKAHTLAKKYNLKNTAIFDHKWL